MKNWLIKRFVLIAHRAHSQSGLSLPTLQFDSHPDFRTFLREVVDV